MATAKSDTKEQIEIVDTNGNPLNSDGSPAYPRVYEIADFLATAPVSAIPEPPTLPIPLPVTSQTLAAATPDLIQLTQAMNPRPLGIISDPTSAFLDKFANLWSTSKLFDLGVISAAAGLILYGIFHGSGSSPSAKISPSVPVMSSAAAEAARQQVTANLAAQTKTLRQMGYAEAQIQTPRDILQFSQDSAISLNSVNSTAAKTQTGALIVTGPKAPNQYATLHELNNPNYFASLSKTPTPDDLLTNSAAMHGDVVSGSR
jgi:hypothetical protein